MLGTRWNRRIGTSLLQVPLQTGRLVIDEFLQSDEDAIHDLFHRERVQEYVGASFRSKPGETWPETFRRVQASSLSGYAIRETESNHLIGFCSVLPIEGEEYEPGDLELTVGLCEDAEGRGFATEALKAVIAHLAKHRTPRRLIGRVAQANNRSMRIVEKLGMERVGHVPNLATGDLDYLYVLHLTDSGAQQANVPDGRSL